MEKYYILVETGNKNATFITNESGYEIFYLFPKQYESLDGSKSPSADFNIVCAENQMIAFKKFVIFPSVEILGIELSFISCWPILGLCK